MGGGPVVDKRQPVGNLHRVEGDGDAGLVPEIEIEGQVNRGAVRIAREVPGVS